MTETIEDTRIDLDKIFSEEEARELRRAEARELERHKQELEEKKGSKTKLKDVLAKYDEVLEKQTQIEKLEKREKGPPNTVVRNLENWERYGWSEDDKQEVRSRLREILGIQEDAALENALSMLLASNKQPHEVLSNLTKENYGEFRKLFKTQVMGEAVKEGEEVLLGRNEPKAKAYFMKQRLGIGEDEANQHLGKYVEKFIFTEDFHGELQHEYDGGLPEDINDLAWQITFENPTEYGVHGRYPVLQLELKQDYDGNIIGARYAVNQGNMIRWMRSQLWYYYDKDEDDLVNYMQAIKLSKNLRNVDLNEIVDNPKRYFTDEEGDSDSYQGLYVQLLSEVIGMIHLRSHDLEYDAVRGQGDKLAEKLIQMYYKSKLTKKSLGTSYFNKMVTTPLDYNSEQSDDTVGGAFTTMYLAHYHLGDFDQLKETLGKDSVFFTKASILDAIQKVYTQKFNATDKLTKHSMVEFLGADLANHFDKAFDENGNVADKSAFTSFVNIYSQGLATSHIMHDVLKEAMFNALRQRYDFHSKDQNINALDGKTGELVEDTDSMNIIWLMVHSMKFFTGISAKNDTGNAGHDYARKWFGTEGYRRKMATLKRGNGTGNPYTIAMFKSVMVDFARAIRVSDAYENVYDQFGKQVFKKNSKGEWVPEKRRKTLLEVFTEVHKEKMKQKQTRGPLEAAFESVRQNYENARKAYMQSKDEYTKLQMISWGDRLQEQIKRLKKYDVESAGGSRKAANQLVFYENTMRDYAINHVDKSRKIYDMLMGAKEINFDKFTSYDAFRGITFNREEFQKQLTQGLLHPLRYLFDSYGDLNMNMMVRAQKFVGRDGDKDKFEWEWMPLGEMLFGYQVLNVPEFRMCKTDKEGKEIKGKYIRDKETGRYVIDYNKVQANKTKAWKQWALMKISGDLWTHIDRHSTDPAYTLSHFKQIIDAIDSIPADIIASDDSLQGMKIGKTFFSKAEMRWLKKVSGATDWRLYRNQVMLDLFGSHKDKESYLSDSFKLFFRGIFKGYS